MSWKSEHAGEGVDRLHAVPPFSGETNMRLKFIRNVFEECLKIWAELAKTGADKKPKTEYAADCPCCQWVKDIAARNCQEANCQDCPFLELWTGDSEYEVTDDFDEPCMGCDSSPFRKWRNSHTSKDRKKYAREIADYCR